MRGKGSAADPGGGRRGITPAHAGKRIKKSFFAPASRDHPRTCGEKTQEVTKYKAYDILHA